MGSQRRQSFCGTSEQCAGCRIGEVPLDDPNHGAVMTAIEHSVTGARHHNNKAAMQGAAWQILHYYGGYEAPVRAVHEAVVHFVVGQMAAGNCFTKV